MKKLVTLQLNVLLNIRNLAVGMDRTFQHRFTVGAASGIVLLLLLAVYAFWTLRPVLGVFLVLALVLVMDQSLNKRYVFRGDKLIIDNGRLSKKRVIELRLITGCRPMTVSFGLVHYLLISYGPAHTVVAVQPRNEQAFVACLGQRRRKVLDAECETGRQGKEQ